MQLCERLQIPRRTLDRYLHELFSEDNQILLRGRAEDAALATNLFIERLLFQRQRLLEDIAFNPNANEDAKVSAHELAIECAFAVKRLSVETAADVLRHSWISEQLQRSKELASKNNNNNSSSNNVVHYLPVKTNEGK